MLYQVSYRQVTTFSDGIQMAGQIWRYRQIQRTLWRTSCTFFPFYILTSTLANQQDRLLISDVKALQYIYQTSGYHFPKQPERKEISRLTSGRSITWADGTFITARQVLLT